MRIDGKAIASKIFEELKEKVQKLQEKQITPHLVVLLIGQDPASIAYVKQKELKTDLIGGQCTIYRLDEKVSMNEIHSLVQKLNNLSSVHGIIIQRPVPPQINANELNDLVAAQKDIDSFHKDSPYPMPLAAAVLKILEHIYYQGLQQNLQKWLQSKHIVVIGKGATGGGPTIELLKKMNIYPTIIDSKTQNPEKLTKNADIIISTVGKKDILKPNMLKKGVILIGVGMYKGEDGILHGDYKEEEIEHIASFYTPIPGGVGPINVAMLLENLVNSASK